MKHLIILIALSAYHMYSDPGTSDETITSPLFSLLSPSTTNIGFVNSLEDTKDHNIMIYSNYYGGAGVGVGDLNNDGLDDIYFAGNLVPDQLYLNRGNLTFQDITGDAGIKDDGAWSSGVLIADVNQDGWKDIYVTRELYDDAPLLRKNVLYINNGLSPQQSVVTGVPTFTEQAQLYNVADTARTRHATFIDFDKDGDLDLFLLNQPPNPGDYSRFYNTPLLQDQYRPRLLENLGPPNETGTTGGFKDISAKAGFDKTGFPNSVTASDINGDGWTDLYIANDFWVGDWYYINNGDGTFTDMIQEYTRHISFSSMGVDAGDINNDGRLDICVVDMAAEDNYRSKANMSGMNPEAFWKVVADGDHYQYMFNMLHLNSGDGHMSDIAQLAGVATTDWSWSVLMADFDNDSWKDIYITNGLMRDIRNNDAAKTLPKHIEGELYKYLQKHPNPVGVGVWDIVDINATLDLVPSEPLQNYMYQNQGDLTFSKKSTDWGFEEETFSNGASYADLDNDGDLDLIINNINKVASIYENHASDQFGKNYLRIQPKIENEAQTIHGTKCWIETEAGQQYFEITGARGMYSTSETTIHFGLGELDHVETLKLQWPDGKITYLSDINSNQTLEIKYSEAGSQDLPSEKVASPYFSKANDETKIDHQHLENDFDDYKTQVLLPHKMSTLGPTLSTADINGDGLEDVFIGGAIYQAGTLLIQKPGGTFIQNNVSTFEEDRKKEDVGSAFLDIDNDGDLDLYVVSGGNEYLPGASGYQDRLYINDGTGHFVKDTIQLKDVTFSGSKVRPADFDKDGDLDLFVGGRHIPWSYPEPASSLLLINQNGHYEKAPNSWGHLITDLGIVNDAVWSDYNNDGWEDLIIVGEWMEITILQNNKGTSFSKLVLQSDIPTSGWWFSIEASDMDGDGDEDIVAGNLGLNYKYKASIEEPFEVYYGDFDNNNSKDIVLTYYNYGIQYPLRGKQCSTQQIPLLKDKIPTYDIFASAGVEQIYGGDALAQALHYEATTFASTYFSNNGDGTFTSQELPNAAQTSSINDIIIDDVNGDGIKDIIIAGNLYNAEVETTRNDAGYGLVLLGDGHGQFSPTTPMETGLFVPYNVKSMATIKNQSGKILLVGCNNDKVRAFSYK